MKLFAYEKFKKTTEARSPGHRGPSKELTTFIGISEVAGAFGLILPAATGIAPILTTLAALGLAIIMFLAVIFHLRQKEPGIGYNRLICAGCLCDCWSGILAG
jgi:uncharacterized membrane protein YphA (DoxX/SURF4 family)